jgi:hypothetical protein
MPLKLAGLLVTSGAVPTAVIEDALRRQVLSGSALDTALFETGAGLTEAQLLQWLEQASGLPGLGAEELLESDPGLAQLLPAKLAERHGLLLLRSDGGILEVAVRYPASAEMLDQIGFLLRRELHARVALEVRLREAIARVYGGSPHPRYQVILEMLGPAPEPSAEGPAPRQGSSPWIAGVRERGGAAASDAPGAPTANEALAAPRGCWAGVANKREGLALAIEQALEAAECPPQCEAEDPANRLAPRAAIDLERLTERIVAISPGRAWVEAEAPEEWTLAKARAAVDGTEDVRQIIRSALRFALKTFDFAAAFAVVGGNAVGWAAQSREGAADEGVERMSIPLDAPSVLRTVLIAKGWYLGPLPSDPLSQSLIAGLQRPEPPCAFLCAIEVRDRPVAILYGDVIGRAASDCDVGELVVFTQYLGQRIERLIVEQKQRLERVAREASGVPASGAGNSAGAGGGEAAAPPAFALRPMLNPGELPASGPPRPRGSARPSEGEVSAVAVAAAPAPGVSSRLMGESLAMPSSMDDLFSAADRLVEADLGERAKALALLARYPEVSAAVLVARFPGPVLRPRVPVAELPSPEELGPIPAALARMGLSAARALVPLFDHRHVDSRYFAVLVAGRLPTPILVGPIAQRVFDRHPVVAGAARVALASMRGVQGFEEALARIRLALSSCDRETVSAAAKALGFLRDAASVEPLIALTGHVNKALALSAADALRDITKQHLGLSHARWAAWWGQAKLRPREEWLLDALRHEDFEVRASAAEELARAAGDGFGFSPGGPRQEREAAVLRFEDWWRSRSAARTT